MKRKTCNECGKSLIKDEIALCKKILGRNMTLFYCLNCLACELDVEKEDLEIKIEEYKEQGCTLF